MYSLVQLGWNSFFQHYFAANTAPGQIPARVAAENKTNYILLHEGGEALGECAGNLLFTAETNAALPKTGDWVAVTLHSDGEYAVIRSVLSRRTVLSRKVAGLASEEQVLAANIDLAFLVQSLDEDFSVNRLQRYVAAVFEGGALPCIVLNKSDVASDIEANRTAVNRAFPDVSVITTNALTGEGVEHLRSRVRVGETAVFLGSSGVGKTTLVNAMLGAALLRTAPVRDADAKGRHTTTRREMHFLPDGGMVLDTPGMREFQPWATESAIVSTFPHIDRLAENCRYADCSHTVESDCAVLEALELGSLDRSTHENYLRLLREQRYLLSKVDENEQRKRKEREKQLGRVIKKYFKGRKE